MQTEALAGKGSRGSFVRGFWELTGWGSVADDFIWCENIGVAWVYAAKCDDYELSLEGRLGELRQQLSTFRPSLLWT